ncbi:MAG: hypothetical protein FD129_2285, partial [bacterium]
EPPPLIAGTPQVFAIEGLAFSTTYWLAMVTLDEVGNRSPVSNVSSFTTPSQSGVTGSGPLVAGFHLRSSNPMRSTALFELVLPPEGAAAASIEVFDVMGRIRRRLDSGSSQERTVSVSWNGCDDSGRLLPDGIYFVSASAGSFRQILRLVLTR